MKNTLKGSINPFILIIGILVLVSIAFYYGQRNTQSIVSAEVVAEKAINYINENMMSEGLQVSLINVEREGDLYKMRIKIDGQEYSSYLTLDGSLLFPEGISLEEEEPTETQEEPEKLPVEGEESLGSLAQCLTEKGFKFYGASWCSWCKKQKELFKSAVDDLPYVECDIEGQDEIAKECKDAGISSYPTWGLPDGSLSVGFKELEELAEISGCSI